MTKKNLTGFREQEECFSREEGRREGRFSGRRRKIVGRTRVPCDMLIASFSTCCVDKIQIC